MNLMPICDAIQAASDQRVSPSTATRWALKGCGGVILQSVLLGKKRLSSVQWVNEFIAARSQPQQQRSNDQSFKEEARWNAWSNGKVVRITSFPLMTAIRSLHAPDLKTHTFQGKLLISRIL